MTATRLPWAPLEAIVARTEVNREPCGTNVQAQARLLGRAARQVYRWRVEGLSFGQADRLCNELGRHPAEIWPTEWVADLDAVAS